jgi:multidrug efflux pump subunit AcrA (membrane-fusion protein)
MLVRMRIAAVLAAALALASLGWAHGTHETVMGTLKEITEGAITIETTKSATRTVAWDAQTRFVKSGEPASAADLQAGERVVVDIHEVKGKPTAAVVRFGPPKR